MNPLQKRTPVILEKIFWVLFLIWSGCVLFVTTLHTFEIYAFGPKKFWFFLILFCLYFVGLFFFMRWIEEKALARSTIWLWIPVILFTTSMLLRAVVIGTFGIDTQQISDYGLAYESSLLTTEEIAATPHYRYFPSWLAFVVVLKFINGLFGASPLTGIIFNAIFMSGAAVLLYFIIYLKFKHLGLAFSTAFLFLAWPGLLLYSIILTPEYLSIFFALLAVLCLVLASKAKKRTHLYALFGAGGMIIAVSGLFKSVDQIYVIALFVILFLKWLRSSESLAEKFKTIALPFLIFAVVYFACGNLFFYLMEASLGVTLSASSTCNYIFVGLNPYNYGMWNEQSTLYPRLMMENNYDSEVVSKMVYEKLFESIAANQHLNFNYFFEKFKISWNADDYISFIVDTLSPRRTISDPLVLTYLGRIITQTFYQLIVIFLFISGIKNLKESDSFSLFSSLVLFGFFLVEIILEVQSRYKLVFYPYVAFLAASALLFAFQKNSWKELFRKNTAA